MPYVPGCARDIFISYASENNRDGWVEHFADALGNELSELLGVRYFHPKESIFLDRRQLQTGQCFPEELAAAARSAAILIPVLSPGYMLSPWCHRERTEFFARLPHGASPCSCLAPVVVRPFEEASLDSVLRNIQRLSFLGADEQTPLPAGSSEWLVLVRRLAGQLKSSLQNLRRGCRPVFVGRGNESPRLQDLRSWCQAELERRHYRTIPESFPALEDPELVRANLEEAGLAIHFLGDACQGALEAVEISVGVCQGPTILYQPFSVNLTVQEKLWLADFERHLPASQCGYQRLTGTNDQELLEVIDEQLTRATAAAQPSDARSELAIVCEEADLNEVRQLNEDIRARRATDVRSPDFLITQLRAMERLRRWQEYMSSSRALIFYQGLSERERLQLMCETAIQRQRDIRCRWFIAPPDLNTKRELDPNALWSVDQVISFLDGEAQAQPA